ncbi:NADP-dependent oxidoreductase [Nocardia iowensis]|uniref:NADP-dependent oxidoreductase n=1 Tax=Nocardia iowensis TaxID=204891 RepID=A0ABX8RYK2_NOCIO|nr:NADP-dependent oxidoreductase [Nocardia iowensis]QXN93440.1 NADP-dependent oxidoreductase [Nocardia iowensis]
MARAVKFDRYGGIEELKVVEVPTPTAGPGQVVVAVVAAGINPGEAYIRTGALHERWPATFPSGQGSDFAGRIVEIGAGVGGVEVGDEVLGFTDNRASHATHVVVPVDQVTPKPTGLEWDVAGALFVAGTTAFAAMRAVEANEGDTVVVSGAAGGVGSITVQLLRARGAEVIGIASAANHDWLRKVGVTPVAYGDGLIERLRAAAPKGVDAFIDTYGADYVDIAVELGVPVERINTIINWAAVEKYGVKADGNAAAATIDILTELADLAAAGTIEVPIAATYPLDKVQEAYRELEQRHTRGKIVLRP